MPHLLVDAHTLRTTSGSQPQTAQVATGVLVLAQVGQIVNAILDGAGAGVVGHHRDAGIERPLDRLAEQVGIGHGQRDAVRLGGHCLIYQLGHLLQVELVRAEDGDVHVHIIGCLLNAGFHRAPERVPGAQRVLHQDEVQHCLWASDLDRHLDRYLDRHLDGHLHFHLSGDLDFLCLDDDLFLRGGRLRWRTGGDHCTKHTHQNQYTQGFHFLPPLLITKIC